MEYSSTATNSRSFVTILEVFSSVTRSQTNRQVEVVNKMIKHNLKTKLKNLKERWADDLLEVFWAYRITTRSTLEKPHSHWPTDMKPWSQSNSGQDP